MAGQVHLCTHTHMLLFHYCPDCGMRNPHSITTPVHPSSCYGTDEVPIVAGNYCPLCGQIIPELAPIAHESDDATD